MTYMNSLHVFTFHFFCAAGGQAKTMSPSCGRCTQRDEYNYKNLEDENKHFLVLMLGDFRQQMIISKEWVRCLKGEIPDEIKLETRNRASYTIKVAKYQEKHVLKVGWPQFVENFHLQLGDSLLFRYNGDSLFSIVIFDKLGREKASSVLVDPFPPQVQGRRGKNKSHLKWLLHCRSARKMNALCETCEIWDEHHYMNLDDEKKYFLMRMTGDFQDKMIIQKEFVQRFKGEIPGEIELETKNKCRYIIQVIKNQEEQLVLAAGWGSFVQKFRLEMGDRIILFGYNGNSWFSVIILDQLGREGDGSFSSHDHVRNALGFRRVVRRNRTSSQKQQQKKDGYITTDKTKLTPAQEQQVKDMVQTIRSRRSGITIFVALIGKANVHPGFSLTVPIMYGQEHFGDGKVICFQLGEKKWNASFNGSRKYYRIESGWRSFRIKRGDLILGNMSNNEETGPSNHDADEMDYEGEQQYLDFLSAKHSQGLRGGLDDGTDADIGTDGGAKTGGEGISTEAATENKK
uniref:B3 domain-containing protein n=1 Tax=Aegilops tauschii TaxID=37682 RepID=M8BSZ1_AEGTA